MDSKGEQLGVLSKIAALEKAKELGQDLIEIAPNANPPVAKIADFQKFRYDENKKDRASRKGANLGDLKELWLSPRIAEHDLKVRLNRTLEFIKDGHKVKLTVKFKGREMAHQELGHQVLQEALTFLGDKVAVERDAKMEGRKLSMIVGKGKSGAKNNEVSTENKQVDVQPLNVSTSIK
ncbi:translation initiation factor IF-3 [Patescibacteria group bacterium]|nr:translation initiation factor IF-3 [Patescibacteria group bacterium]